MQDLVLYDSDLFPVLAPPRPVDELYTSLPFDVHPAALNPDQQRARLRRAEDKAKIGGLLASCLVPEALVDQRFGTWEIRRQQPFFDPSYPRDIVTLFNWQKMLDGRNNVVMEDSAWELSRHLPILLAARGRVLVTGLGLGCVLRGLLSKPEVDQVDVIEIDPEIIERVGVEFAGDTRVRFFLGDARNVTLIPDSLPYDYAWHDIWSPEGEAVLHAQLLVTWWKRARAQGVWGFPRYLRRPSRWKGFRFIGTRRRG